MIWVGAKKCFCHENKLKLPHSYSHLVSPGSLFCSLDRDSKVSTCHSRVVYIAICLPNKDIGLIYFSKDVPEPTFLAFSASLGFFPQVFSGAKWIPQVFFFLRTNWCLQGSRSWLSENLNHCSGPELLMIFFIVIRYMWLFVVTHSLKPIRLFSFWRMGMKSKSRKD